jgi:glycosyltransferase involved in cell wall biosynthesis
MTEKKVWRAASLLNVAYIIGTYPTSTTTFIDREIHVLRRLGVDLQVISIRRPVNDLSPQQENQAGIHYVLPVDIGVLVWNHLRLITSRPRVYLRTFVHLLTRPHPTLRARLRTIMHFGLGVHTSELLRQRYPCDHIHAHFVDRAALVALIAGRLLDRPFSATAHANDIYVDPVLLSEKIAQAKFIATCTQYNKSHLLAVPSTKPGRLRCIYHGIDFCKYRPRPRRQRPRPLLLAVGQLKEKKGFVYLLGACRILADRGVGFDCWIAGDGPLRHALEAKIAELSLQHSVSLLGSLPHEAVIEKYSQATIFVLPCVTGSDGDRDGIPNVILEAMALGLPVVSTRHSGIPEAIEDGHSGLLVTPGDSTALADSLAQLIADEGLRKRLGCCARQKIIETFDVEVNVKKLLAEFIA